MNVSTLSLKVVVPVLVLLGLILPLYASDFSEAELATTELESSAAYLARQNDVVIGSCSASFGCDVSDLSHDSAEEFDYDLLLEELAESITSE